MRLFLPQSICLLNLTISVQVRADFKLIAKALGRIGSCYLKKEDYDNAIKYFQKSLTEHRTPDILNKLRDAEKAKKLEETTKYINPELAEKAREEGNTKFKVGSSHGMTLGNSNATTLRLANMQSRSRCTQKLSSVPHPIHEGTITARQHTRNSLRFRRRSKMQRKRSKSTRPSSRATSGRV